MITHADFEKVLEKAKEPFLDKFNERLEAIKTFDKFISKRSLPQDKFMAYMREFIEDGHIAQNGCGQYVFYAAERLFADNVPLSQVKACINNFAPEAVYDPAMKQIFGDDKQPYAKFIALQAEYSAYLKGMTDKTHRTR